MDLSGPRQRPLGVLAPIAPLVLFLAIDAQRGPGDSFQTLQADLFLAVLTGTVAAFLNAVERGPDVAQNFRFALQTARGQFTRRAPS